jgi:heme-degrading monooxygenase HmoA
MAAFEVDPGTAKMVLLFGGAGVVAIVGLWRTLAAGRAFERQRLAREAEARQADVRATAASDPGPPV